MPFLNPFGSTICPLCFETFHISDAPIGSRATGKKKLADRSSSGPFKRLYVSNLIDKGQYKGLNPRRLCPQCQEYLPTKIDYMSNELIAIIGSTAAGKSHYMVSLINELNKRPFFLKQIGCKPLIAAEEDTVTTYENYYQVLYEQRQELPPTPSRLLQQTDRPLMYQLIHPGPLGFGTRRINLVFFDTAGEDVAVGGALSAVYNRYITSASGIILFIDPLQVTNIGPALRGAGGQGVTLNSKLGTDKVIQRMIHVFQEQTKLRPGDPITVPTALVLSKADMLWNLPIVPRNSLLFQESLHQQGFDYADHKAVEQEVIGLLQQAGGQAVLEQARSNFTRYSFFAVSATGSASDPTTHQFPTIQPRRCVDPLLWLLSQLGLGNRS